MKQESIKTNLQSIRELAVGNNGRFIQFEKKGKNDT